MTIGDKVLHMRVNAGLTQRELAALAHIPQPTISLLERGLVDADTIHLGFFRRLAQTLDIPLGLLIHQEVSHGHLSQGPAKPGGPGAHAQALAPSPASPTPD